MDVLLINPNTNDDTTAKMVAIAAAAMPDLRFLGRTAPFGPNMIVEPIALAESARAVEVMAQDVGGAAGVIVAAFGDPGLDAVRARLDVPVIGIGEASILDAARDGRRFAIATTTPALVDPIAARVAHYGCAGSFAGTFLTPGDPNAIVADPGLLADALTAAARRAIAEGGAEAVIIGGGPLAAAAHVISTRLGAAIVEPIPAAARLIAERLSV
ncbi:aspartate/glutamate racemase family protein [Acuticoccus sp. M5D2P5]|uniref:aspartate/glutamate racemase family protein n=1 Tax=Acuticoccus kalidii TaxID=2910977 RepID=UPI001F1DCC67|nr:aspartate/glutamate racemase family protein [Acuticoccus kalidii]MCF3931971.1 aspartate/glutamate racemase family protein [Acuticoccus kalidii]